MVRRSYRFLWWVLLFVIAASVIWYVEGKKKGKEYKNGTLVYNEFFIEDSFRTVPWCASVETALGGIVYGQYNISECGSKYSG